MDLCRGRWYLRTSRKNSQGRAAVDRDRELRRVLGHRVRRPVGALPPAVLVRVNHDDIEPVAVVVLRPIPQDLHVLDRRPPPAGVVVADRGHAAEREIALVPRLDDAAVVVPRRAGHAARQREREQRRRQVGFPHGGEDRVVRRNVVVQAGHHGIREPQQPRGEAIAEPGSLVDQSQLLMVHLHVANVDILISEPPGDEGAVRVRPSKGLVRDRATREVTHEPWTKAAVREGDLAQELETLASIPFHAVV